MDNSYNAMRELDWVEISVSIQEASIGAYVDERSMSEDMGYEITLRGSMVNARRLREYDDSVSFPWKSIQISVIELRENTESPMEGKFPFGAIKIENEGGHCRLSVRRPLLETICQSVSAVVYGDIAITISLPFLEIYELGVYYPVLAYGVYIQSPRRAESRRVSVA